MDSFCNRIWCETSNDCKHIKILGLSMRGLDGSVCLDEILLIPLLSRVHSLMIVWILRFSEVHNWVLEARARQRHDQGPQKIHS